MPSVNTLNSGDSRTFEAPVHSIRVDVGTVTVTGGENVDVVKEGTEFDAKDTASLRVHAVTGARFLVTQTDEAPAPKVTKVSAPKPAPKKASK